MKNSPKSIGAFFLQQIQNKSLVLGSQYGQNTSCDLKYNGLYKQESLYILYTHSIQCTIYTILSIQSTPSHGCSFFCQGSKKRTEKIDDFPSLLLLCTIYSAQKREKNSAIIAKITEEFFLTKGCLWTKTFFGCVLFVIFFSDF